MTTKHKRATPQQLALLNQSISSTLLHVVARSAPVAFHQQATPLL